MNNIITKYLVLIPLYVFLQVLILNEILFFNYINPYLYIILIISLPVKTPKWFLLIYALIIGCLIDLFNGSLGYHSTATIFIAFIKPIIGKITIPHKILNDIDEICLRKIGPKSFITFSFLLILIHNCILFLLEHLTINFAITLKVVLSSFITLILVLILDLFQSKQK